MTKVMNVMIEEVFLSCPLGCECENLVLSHDEEILSIVGNLVSKGDCFD